MLKTYKVTKKSLQVSLDSSFGMALAFSAQKASINCFCAVADGLMMAGSAGRMPDDVK